MTTPNPLESVAIRYLTTLLVTVIKTGLSFLAGLLVARDLGPEEYGNLQFLLRMFAALGSVMDLGSSSAFYTFLSRNKRSTRFFAAYFFWVVLQFLLLLFLSIVLLPRPWFAAFWLGQQPELVFLALAATFSVHRVWQLISEIGESIRATVLVQTWSVVLGLAHFVLIVAVIKMQVLSAPLYLLFLTAEHLLVSLILLLLLRGRYLTTTPPLDESLSQIFGEFRGYCTPLILYSLGGFVMDWANTWLLHHYSGSAEQGFFAIGEKFSVLCLLGTTAVLKIFWKEVSDAEGNRDFQRQQDLFVKVARSTFFVAAMFACFLVPYSRQLLITFLGAKFEAGWAALALMLLVPLYSSLAQVVATLLYAKEKTRLYRNLWFIKMGLTLPATYWVLAPATAWIPGLGLGALGLAAKTVGVGIISVNIMLYVLCRHQGWTMNFAYQFTLPLIFLTLGFAVKAAILSLPIQPLSFFTLLILGGIPYFLCCVALLYLWPEQAGLQREDFQRVLGRLKDLAQYRRSR